MNWILLIIAGLFEVAFAACLGKAKESNGFEITFWNIEFIICLGVSMFLLVKVTQVTYRYSLCSLDGHRSCRYRSSRYRFF